MKNLHPILKSITPRIEDWIYETSQTNYFNENRENENKRCFSGYFFSTLMPTVNKWINSEYYYII